MRVRISRICLAVLAAAGAAAIAAAARSEAAPEITPAGFAIVVNSILALPYQPNYVPLGADSAFPMDANNLAPVPNTLPAQDYTSGSVPGDPDHPNWPVSFVYKTKVDGLQGFDGSPLRGYLALHPGTHPGIVVVHGFNTNGKESVIRWAAMLYAAGYDVLASDQRDFKDESNHGEGYPAHLQTAGWKESEDVLAAAQYLKNQPGVGKIGVVGFSEGAQNTILALAADTNHIFSAGLTFSAPADQDTQIWSTRAPSNCMPGSCQYPVSDALINLVVPPYGNGGKYFAACDFFSDAAAYYHASIAGVLAREQAYHAQTAIQVPLLNFYAQDDSLVQDFQARMTAGYEVGHPLQKTIELTRGEHAYFFDRYWDQQAILTYFKGMLGDALASVTPTVNQTPGGAPASTQQVDLSTATAAEADSYQAPLICTGAPTAASVRWFRAHRRSTR